MSADHVIERSALQRTYSGTSTNQARGGEVQQLKSYFYTNKTKAT